MTETLTMADAKRLGYKLVRGDYHGTTDNRADRWYWQHDDDQMSNRRAAGYPTEEDALAWLAYQLPPEHK